MYKGKYSESAALQFRIHRLILKLKSLKYHLKSSDLSRCCMAFIYILIFILFVIFSGIALKNLTAKKIDSNQTVDIQTKLKESSTELAHPFAKFGNENAEKLMMENLNRFDEGYEDYFSDDNLPDNEEIDNMLDAIADQMFEMASLLEVSIDESDPDCGKQFYKPKLGQPAKKLMLTLRKIPSKELTASGMVTLSGTYKVREKKELIPAQCGSPVQHILLTTWKTTTKSIFNQLFNLFPSNFHHFDPLIKQHTHTIDGVYLNPIDNSTKPIKLINDLIQCNFNGVTSIDDVISEFNTNRFIMDETFLDHCIDPKSQTLYHGILKSFCQLFPMHSILSTLPNIEFIDSLLSAENIALFRGVVFMSRDPRAIIANQNGCESATSCQDIKTYCKTLTTDYIELERYKNRYPKGLMLVSNENQWISMTHTDSFHSDFRHFKYEDFINSPKSIIKMMFSFYGIKLTEKIVNRIDDIIKKDDDIMKGSETLISWTKKLSKENLDTIQELCRQPIQLWGYKLLAADRLNDTSYLKSIYYRPH